MPARGPILTDAQLVAELDRCEYCEAAPCAAACPAACSPRDFIMAASGGEPSDFRRAAAAILTANPLGGTCGVLCPDHHCLAACTRSRFDRAVEIPAIQATIVAKARALGVTPRLDPPRPTGRRVAVVGAGPAGLAASAFLAREGHAVTLFDRGASPGGACRVVPARRLPTDVLDADLDFVMGLGAIEVQCGQAIGDPGSLLACGFDTVVVAAGLWAPVPLGIPGEDATVAGLAFLATPEAFPVAGRRVAVVGGGATAVDCAVTASEMGAADVELVARRAWADLRLTRRERDDLLEHRVAVTGRTRITEVARHDGAIAGVRTVRTVPRPGSAGPFPPLEDVPGSEAWRPDIDVVILATGARRALATTDAPGVWRAGDFALGATDVVTAVASGKDVAARIHASLCGATTAAPSGERRCTARLSGYRELPVPLDADFFGRRIASPFLLSAAPLTDGYDQVRLAYEAGWAGAVMKTAFDGVPIHIPGAYMHVFDRCTYANCDNVSGHPLDRVCREVERLVREFPDRLTAASTGGPVTGDHDGDRRGWQSNTRKLDAAGAMAVEYSLSCPQGGDGTEGDIVSQSAARSATIVDWVLEASDPAVPKLFKLTAAVTSIASIVGAIKTVFDRHPGKPAGITLANSFPTLAFRPLAPGRAWEKGVVVGMSGRGVAPISFLTLAKVAHLGVTVSGNGGPMDYKAAAHFLALGARNVQFCTIATKHGLGVVRELHSGLSHLMAERGIACVAGLVGCALPDPITPFPDLPATKLVSQLRPELCIACGNCARCPYLAITIDVEGRPATDASRCIGCSICAKKCIAGALYMRERGPDEEGMEP